MDKIIASGRFGRFFDSTRYVLVRSSGTFANARNDFLGGFTRRTKHGFLLFHLDMLLSVTFSDSIVVRKQKFTLEIKPLARLSNRRDVHLPAGWTSRRLGGPG